MKNFLKNAFMGAVGGLLAGGLFYVIDPVENFQKEYPSLSKQDAVHLRNNELGFLAVLVGLGCFSDRMVADRRRKSSAPKPKPQIS